MHFDRNPFMSSCEGGKKALMASNFGTSIGSFPKDGAASMAVKGLMYLALKRYVRLNGMGAKTRSLTNRLCMKAAVWF